MSMHDIEGVVEVSVYCIDESNLSLEKKRDLLYNLYKFQSEYDTGYTNFRVKDILLKNHYMFALPIEVHPDYAEKKEEFDSYVEKRYSEWLTDDSILEPEENGNSLFYVDAGSDTWKKLVENGVLTGKQAIPVNDLSIFETVLEVVKLCREQQNTECAAEWLRTVLFYLLWEAKDEDDETLNSIAEILFNNAVLMSAKDDYYFSRSIEDMKEGFEDADIPEKINKWLEAYTKWEENMDNDPYTYLHQTIQKFRNQDIQSAFESCKKGLQLAPNDPFLLLYEAILSILTLHSKSQDLQDYEPWLNRLQELQNTEGETEENLRIILTHALYYTAYAYLICNKQAEAKEIAEQLVNDYQMSEAKELLDYILRAEK